MTAYHVISQDSESFGIDAVTFNQTFNPLYSHHGLLLEVGDTHTFETL